MTSRKRSKCSKTKSNSNRVDNDSDLESLEENSVLEENSIVASSDFCCGIDMSLVQVVLGNTMESMENNVVIVSMQTWALEGKDLLISDVSSLYQMIQFLWEVFTLLMEARHLLNI